MRRQPNGPRFDVCAALFALLGKDLTQINGLGPYLALKLIAECGDDLSAWPSAKHFTSWLCLAPSNKISAGKVLSSRTRRSGSRAAALLRLAAVTVGRTDAALGAFYRRLFARIGKVKAITATARKIAVLFYNAMHHGMDQSKSIPGRPPTRPVIVRGSSATCVARQGFRLRPPANGADVRFLGPRNQEFKRGRGLGTSRA
jgi:hypothetical protein